MTEVAFKFTCSKCRYELQENEKICPKCGSKEKNILMTVHEYISLGECMKLKNNQLPSDQKLRLEIREGTVPSQITKDKRAKRKRVIDKDNNYYYEHVEDCDGNILIHQEEPLSQHWGHGSAKKTSDNSHKPD